MTDQTDPAAVAARFKERAHLYRTTDGANGRVMASAFANYCDEAASLIEAQAAEIAKLKAEREWRPIETAPRDGTLFLALPADRQRDPRPQCVLIEEEETSTYIGPLDGYIWRYLDSYTHWLPLPPLPETSESGGGGENG